MAMIIAVNTNVIIKEKNVIVSHWSFSVFFIFQDIFYNLLVLMSNETEKFIFSQSYKK